MLTSVFCVFCLQNRLLWLHSPRGRSPLISTGILISPARLQVMHCTHFFKPLTCPVWTVGSMGLGAYSQQLSVQEPFSGSNDWQNFLSAHYAGSFSCFSAQFWELRWSFSDRFFSTHHHLPHCLVATLSGSSVNSHQVLNWVIRCDSPSEDWMAQPWGGLTSLFQSLKSQRWTGQISTVLSVLCMRVHALWQSSAMLRQTLRKPDRKVASRDPFSSRNFWSEAPKKKLPQMSHEPSV